MLIVSFQILAFSSKRSLTLTQKLSSLLCVVMMSFIAESLEAAPIDSSVYPNISRWHKSIQTRPAYQRAEEKGGKNDLTMFVK